MNTKINNIAISVLYLLTKRVIFEKAEEKWLLQYCDSLIK